MLSGRWHDSHFCWKIGATSLVNVTAFAGSAADAAPENVRTAPIAHAPNPRVLRVPPIISAPFQTNHLRLCTGGAPGAIPLRYLFATGWVILWRERSGCTDPLPSTFETVQDPPPNWT